MTSLQFHRVVGHQLVKDMFERYLKKKIPHSLVFIGPKGIGKRIFAEELISLLLCESHNVCGVCAGCREWQKQDSQGCYFFHRGEVITIDQVREIKEQLTKSDWRGMARVVVVEDAESITIPAANAILKILEEPGVKIYYIFIAENLKRVLGTIISRSVILPFNRLTSQEMDVVLRQKGMQDPDLKKILMGLPARIDQFSAISREKHLKNVKNFWQLLMTDAAAKMALVEKIAKLDKKRLMGLMFFWESCLRDYLMWQLHQSENRWWQTQEIDELYNRLPKLDVGEKLRQLSLIKEKFATVSKKIQLFNWLINT